MNQEPNMNAPQNPIPPMQPPFTPQNNGKSKSIAALVLGCIGIVFGFIYTAGVFLPIIGFVCAILAIIFGAMGMKACPKGEPGRGLAVAGLVLGIVATALTLLFIICAASLLCAAASFINSAGSEDWSQYFN